MSDSIRTLRVAELIKHELAGILSKDIKDPRVKDVVITKVKVTKDLSMARVYFSSYVKKNLMDMQIGLEKSAGFIRKKLMGNVHLKKLPQLIFERDETPENVEKLDALFEQLHSESSRGTGEE